MTLSKQNIEVWIDDGSKPYGFPGYYCCKCIIDGGKPVNMMIEFDGNNWGEADTKRIGYDTFDILGWQASVKDVYVLTAYGGRNKRIAFRGI